MSNLAVLVNTNRLGLDSRGRVADALFWRRHLLLRLLGQLHVEEPLVDLDARKACLLHGFFAHLSVPFAAKLEEQTAEVFDLLFRLFAATDFVRDHLCERAAWRLFLFGDSSDLWWCWLRHIHQRRVVGRARHNDRGQM